MLVIIQSSNGSAGSKTITLHMVTYHFYKQLKEVKTSYVNFLKSMCNSSISLICSKFILSSRPCEIFVVYFSSYFIK